MKGCKQILKALEMFRIFLKSIKRVKKQWVKPHVKH